MLKLLYSCYSIACWPISCLFCYGRKRSTSSPEAISPSTIDGSPEDVENQFINGGYDSRRSHGSIATDILPTILPPQIFVQKSEGFDNENLEVTGTVSIRCQYSAQKKLLILTVIEASESETGQERTQIQVRLALLEVTPIKKLRTKLLPGSTAKFAQTFTFGIEPDDLFYSKLRFRLYRLKSSFKRDQFRGECLFPTQDIETKVGAPQTSHLLHFHLPASSLLKKKSSPPSLESQLPPLQSLPISDSSDMIRRQHSSVIGSHVNSVNTCHPPARRNSTVDSSGRFCALPTENGQPEVLISLCYLDQSQKVVVAVEKASNLCHDSIDKVSETYIRVSVLSQFGEELAKHRSATVKASSDAVYDCTAVFQIPRNDLENSSVLIQVFRNNGMLRRRHQIGFVCVGENASSPDAQDHWNQMIQGLGTSVEKWHYLRKPDMEKS